MRSGSFSHQDVSKLKEKGAVNKEMRTKDNDFISPLLISIHKKCPVSYATALIDAGADVNDQYHGTTALHFAVNNQQMDMIDMLLNKAPDLVNTHDSYGNTPLHYAVAGRVNTEITKKLIDNGASLLAANNKGNTPKDYAASMDDENVKKLFDIPDSKQQEHSKEKETGNDKNPTTPMNRSQKFAGGGALVGAAVFVIGLFTTTPVIVVGAIVTAISSFTIFAAHDHGNTKGQKPQNNASLMESKPELSPEYIKRIQKNQNTSHISRH